MHVDSRLSVPPGDQESCWHSDLLQKQYVEQNQGCDYPLVCDIDETALQTLCSVWGS